MNNNHLPTSFFLNSEQETANQLSLALIGIFYIPYSKLPLKGPNICEHHSDLQKFLLVANVFVQYFYLIKVVYFRFFLHTWNKIQKSSWKSKSLHKYLNSKYFFWERFSQHHKHLDLTTITHYTVRLKRNNYTLWFQVLLKLTIKHL